MSLYRRKGEAYLGGHSLVVEPPSVHWDDKVCSEQEFRDFCADIFYSVVPPKARLAKLFKLHRFKLAQGRWHEETARLAFAKVIAQENKRHFGPERVRAITLNGNPGPTPRVLGVDGEGRPYAWSLTEWK